MPHARNRMRDDVPCSSGLADKDGRAAQGVRRLAREVMTARIRKDGVRVA